MVSVHTPPTDISVLSEPYVVLAQYVSLLFVILQVIMKSLPTEHGRCCIETDISCMRLALQSNILILQLL